ncbi:MAG: hypothetical protein MUC47_05940 [Candidatus Kapabacteria bacterium]|nr:hypothetical protein [Candidatus Kapabacteria bacterium]
MSIVLMRLEKRIPSHQALGGFPSVSKIADSGRGKPTANLVVVLATCG